MVEMLTALVISGILGTVIFEFVRSQGRFTEVQNAREEVQQNARAALELIAGDLRGVGPTGITSASANAITVRVPTAWAVHCGYLGSNLIVAFPATALPALARTPLSLAVSPIYPSVTWRFAPVTDKTGTLSALGLNAVTGVCNTALANATTATPYVVPTDLANSRVRVLEPAGGATLPGAEKADAVYLYDTVAYDVANNPSGLSGWWIRRNGAPIAGPLANDQGMRFRYLNSASATFNPGGTAPLDMSQVRGVQLDVVTNSRTQFNGVPQVESATTRVYLRNRS